MFHNTFQSGVISILSARGYEIIDRYCFLLWCPAALRQAWLLHDLLSLAFHSHSTSHLHYLSSSLTLSLFPTHPQVVHTRSSYGIFFQSDHLSMVVTVGFAVQMVMIMLTITNIQRRRRMQILVVSTRWVDRPSKLSAPNYHETTLRVRQYRKILIPQQRRHGPPSESHSLTCISRSVFRHYNLIFRSRWRYWMISEWYEDFAPPPINQQPWSNRIFVWCHWGWKGNRGGWHVTHCCCQPRSKS